MSGSIIALLMGFQAAVLVPVAPPANQRTDAHSDMVLNPVTGHYLSIIGSASAQGARREVPAGTRLDYRRVGRKIGAAPIGH